MIRVEATITPVPTGYGNDWQKVITFKPTTDEDLSATNPVSLARVPDHCFFNITELHYHDSHSPPMESLDEAMSYLSRVRKDIEIVIGKPSEDKWDEDEIKEAIKDMDQEVTVLAYSGGTKTHESVIGKVKTGFDLPLPGGNPECESDSEDKFEEDEPDDDSENGHDNPISPVYND